MTDKYNKLVRDKIPEIIEKQGDRPKTETLAGERLFAALNEKLREETAEYLESYDAAELADIAEVVLAIARHMGLSAADFHALRQKKREERGGFEHGVMLLEVERGER